MATIFCFSSTGNSLYAANKIAGTIGGEVLPMNDGNSSCESDVVGLVFPVYFWGLPRMVERFLKELELTNKNAYVFAVITCGGSCFGVLGAVKNLLRSKSIQLNYGKMLISPSNYLPEFVAKDSEESRQKIDENISIISNAVKNRESNRIPATTILNKIIYTTFPNENSDRYFTVSSSCTGCGTCAKVCPAKNISIEDSRPVFHHKCEHCLGCLHNCPAQAIDWKNRTKNKPRFRNAGVTLDELISFESHKSEF